MSTPQRNRKPGLRYPNGRLRRPTKADLEAVERARAEIEMQVVLNQPHRRGNRDQGCECALGRFFIRLKLKTELRSAAECYRETKRRWRAAWGAPTIDRIEGGGGLGPADETVQRWAREIMRMEHAAYRASPFGLGPLVWLAIQDLDTLPKYDQDIIGAITAIALELGYVQENVHPFQKSA